MPIWATCNLKETKKASVTSKSFFFLRKKKGGAVIISYPSNPVIIRNSKIIASLTSSFSLKSNMYEFRMKSYTANIIIGCVYFTFLQCSSIFLEPQVN